MNKKTQKGLVAAITATMGAGIVAPAAMAAVDPVAAARQAVERLESAEKYQNAKEIEACRALVKNLTDAKAKNELTVRINRVMLGEYTEATNAVKKAKETRTQKDVSLAYNEAVNLTNDDAVRKNALINALNVVQKELYTKVDKALAKADTELKQEYLNEAQAIIKDMLNPWRKPREAKYTQLQVKLYVNTRTALQTAKNSGLKADYEIAKALYENVKTVTNNKTVEGWVKNVLTPLFESIVLDSTNPVVTGVEEGKAYNTAVTPASEEEGLTATLTRNGEVVEYTFGEDITEEGVYELNVFDANENVTTLHFTVDMTAPVFKYDGETTINVKYGEEFTLPTMEASELSAVITPVIVDENDKVVEKIDTKVPGIYTVTYTAVDVAGNEAELVLTVVVAEDNVAVETVTNVTKTTVDVKLVEARADLTADKFEVKVGDAVLPVTAVKANATNTVYTLTVALDKLEGKVNVNGVDSAAFDYKVPEIKSVTPVSSTQFDVTFSEAVNSGLAQVKANYGLVEAGTANVLTSQITNVEILSSSKVRVTVNASQLVKGTMYTVSVAGMQDVSVNKNTMTKTSSMNFVAIKDEVKPTLVSAVATDANKIELTMSEEMSAAGIATVKKYKADGTLESTTIANTVALDSVNKAKMVLTITGSPDYMVNGATYQVELSGGSDLEGNVIAADQKVNVAGLRDAVAPTVIGTTFADNKLTMTFSEKMDTTNLTNSAKYYIFNTATGAPVTAGYAVTKNTANTEVYLTFTDGTLAADTNYTVRIDNQQDAAITPNALAANTIVTFRTPVAAAAPVKLSGAVAGVDGKSVVLTMSGTFSKEEAENIANYSVVDANDETKVLAVTAAKLDSATQVTLTTNAQEQGIANYKVIVKNFGNLSTVATDLSRTFNGIDKVKPAITGIQQLGLSSADLIFSENMLADQTGVTVTVVETGTATTVGVATLGATSGNGNKIRVAFTTPLEAGKNYTLTITDAKDRATVANLSGAQTIQFTAAADTTAPTITNAVSINAATVELTFSEEIATTGTLSATNFVLTKGTTQVNWDANTTFVVDPVSKNKVTITNKVGASQVALFENGQSYTIKVVNDANTNYIADVAGNKVNDVRYAFTGVKDTVKPTVVSATMLPTDDTKLVVKFSENMLSAGLNTDYIITNAKTGAPVALSATAPALGTGTKANEVTLTLAGSTVAGTEYRVFVANGSGQIKDLAVVGNLVDTNYATALFTGIDTVAPTVATATRQLMSASTVKLSFNEKLDAASVSASDFSITGMTVTNAVVQSNGTDVVLTFSGNTDTALVPAVKLVEGAKIADITGNEVTGGVSGTAITGTYTDSAAPTLIGSAVTAVGATSTITLTFSEDVAGIDTAVVDSEIASVPGYTIADITANGTSTNVVITITGNLTGIAPTIIVGNSGSHITDKATVPNVYVGGDAVIATKN